MILEELQKEQIKSNLPDFEVGDTVSVHLRIIEGNKERTQVITGTVIGRSGRGMGETFHLHRIAYGEGMEWVFLINSPRISKITVDRKGHVRRAKLTYLRGTSGKKSRVKERILSQNNK